MSVISHATQATPRDQIMGWILEEECFIRRNHWDQCYTVLKWFENPGPPTPYLVQIVVILIIYVGLHLIIMLFFV